MIKVGTEVKNIWTMRKSKAYAKFGVPAVNGDAGPVVAIHDLRDVMIVVLSTANGNRYTHIQNVVAR